MPSISTYTAVADLSRESVQERVHRQLLSDCEIGLITPCDDRRLHAIAEETVEALWVTSRIKTYLPVLALRRARDEIRAAAFADRSAASLRRQA